MIVVVVLAAAAATVCIGGGISGVASIGDVLSCLSFHRATRWYRPLELQLAFVDDIATFTGTPYCVAYL